MPARPASASLALVACNSSAKALLAAVEKKAIATRDLSADIVRQLRRTADVLRQIHRISGLPLRLIQLAREALKLIYREPIKEIELPEENDLIEQEAEKPDVSEETVTLSFAEPVPAATEDS